MQIVQAARHDQKATVAPEPTNKQSKLKDDIVPRCSDGSISDRGHIIGSKHKNPEIAIVQTWSINEAIAVLDGLNTP
ncbi:hypothetical protein ACVIG9_002231 [Bradyrhizobium ottawaense]